MPTPTEHKTVQTQILDYAEAIGWTFVSREEAEQRRGFEPQMTQISADKKISEKNLRPSAQSAVQKLSLFFGTLLDAKVRNPLTQNLFS